MRSTGADVRKTSQQVTSLFRLFYIRLDWHPKRNLAPKEIKIRSTREKPKETERKPEEIQRWKGCSECLPVQEGHWGTLRRIRRLWTRRSRFTFPLSLSSKCSNTVTSWRQDKFYFNFRAALWFFDSHHFQTLIRVFQFVFFWFGDWE